MKKFKVTEDVIIEALAGDEAEVPMIYLVFHDFPGDCQTIPVFADEIRILIATLTDAAVWLVDHWREP